MITLKTLSKATEQEVFDQVADHLLTQLYKSEDTYSGGLVCRYRNQEGLKCAAGCLIADDEYDPYLMEGKSWFSLVNSGDVDSYHSFLINDLQTIHDRFNVNSWKEELFALAKNYNLNTDVLNKYAS